MSIWVILPISLPVFTITGIWVVYAMALYNQHVCPVDNWLYNQSCEEKLSLQRGPVLCCTLDNVPLISKCGTLPPESCFFSLICSTGCFMVMLIGLLRYAHVIEKHQNCVLNTASLSTGWICAAGLIMVGNFQKKAIQQQLEQEQQKAMDEAVHQRQMKEEYKITGEVPEEEPNVPNKVQEPPATPPPAPVSEKPNKFNPPKLAAVDEGDDGAGFELVSVDGVFLQGDTDPHAVDIIHRAFSNKAKDPMMCIVEAPKIP